MDARQDRAQGDQEGARGKYPVMDESGQAREWLEAGRGLRVWESQDIGAGRPDMLTPGDREDSPHWAYPKSEILGPDDVVFYAKVQVVRHWTDTPAGWRAARRWVEKHGQPQERDAPVGKVYTRYTVQGVELHSKEQVHMPGHPGRPPVIPPTESYDRPLMSLYVVGVVQWMAIVKVGD